MAIETAHLQLVPFSPEALLGLIEGVGQFEARSGLRAADGLREFFVSDAVSPDWLAQLRASTGPDPWLHGFAVVDREDRSVIGSAGFAGPPDDSGTVEIAYGIVPSRQGRGLATEAARALIAFASASARVRRIRAHTLPEANASTRVLEKCGFERIGEIVDPRDGTIWRWAPSSASGITF